NGVPGSGSVPGSYVTIRFTRSSRSRSRRARMSSSPNADNATSATTTSRIDRTTMADLLSNGLERIGRQTDHRQVLDLQMPVVQPLQVTTPPDNVHQLGQRGQLV